MPDSRFFQVLGPVTVGELATLTGAALADASHKDRTIGGVAPLGRASGDEVAYLGDLRYLPDLKGARAGACFMLAEHAALAPPDCAVLVTARPQEAYALAALRLHRPRIHGAGPAIHPDAELEEGVILAYGAVVGPGARIGAGTEIGAHAVIGPGVQIGRRGRIGSNTAISFALIGDEVSIYAGAVIGEAGFSVAVGASGTLDVPQLGRVILQDRVTVGANSCIDRGAWDDTVIGENTKIDNLVQIAHNVRIGRNCVLAAQTGISGSCTIGDGAVFGGRAGLTDHLNIGEGARIAAAAGIMKNVPPGETWAGLPGRPFRRFMKETAWLARLSRGSARRGDNGENG